MLFLYSFKMRILRSILVNVRTCKELLPFILTVSKCTIMMMIIFFQMISDLNTYLNKAVPDTRLTIKKYLDVKFEYLVSLEILLARKFKKAIFFQKKMLRYIILKVKDEICFEICFRVLKSYILDILFLKCPLG